MTGSDIHGGIMIKAIVFDFDGMILDTETAEFQSWQELYVEYGVSLELNEWAQCVGRGANDVRFDPYARLEELLQRPIEYDKIRERRRERNLELIRDMGPRPGIMEYLDMARHIGLKLGVASSGTRAWVVGHLKRLGLFDRFDTVRCADDVERAKPYPDLYLLAVRDLGVLPHEAVALEDSPNGMAAAVAAGLYTIWVPNSVTESLPTFGYDLRLGSLLDLPLGDLIEGVGEPEAISL